jgi:hypothetical protein
VEQAGPKRAVWAVALVPAATRAALAADPTVPGAAGVNRLSLGIDMGAGVDAKLVADLATHAEAEAMAQQVRNAVVAAKRKPPRSCCWAGPVPGQRRQSRGGGWV